MALATWWRGDAVPPLPSLNDVRAAPTDNTDLIARLGGLAVGTVRARINTGNQPYVAWVGGTPVAYGWAAQAEAEVGEYNLTFRVPPANRYLWDFATLPAWRGRGIYPRLLQAMMAHELGAERFWIIHLPDNWASERGIRTAGLRAVGELTAPHVDGVGLVTYAATVRARAGAALLGVPLLRAQLPTALSAQWPAGADVRRDACRAADDAAGTGPRPRSDRAQCAVVGTAVAHLSTRLSGAASGAGAQGSQAGCRTTRISRSNQHDDHALVRQLHIGALDG